MDRVDRAGFAAFLLAVAAGMTPAPAMSVSVWAASDRQISKDSTSPYPGPWDNSRVPYLPEVMDACGRDHPASTVAIMASAQSAKSEAVLNAIGHTICQDPVPILVMLPSLDEVGKYNADKLQLLIDATPSIKAKWEEQVSRDETGSTTAYKKFGRAKVRLINSGSSRPLQMVSAAVLVFEEPTGYAFDVDGRGDPCDQARARTKAWRERGVKEIMVGTPGIKGQCRVDKAYQASDMRQWYVPCPHCGAFQSIQPGQLQWTNKKPPHNAYVVCAAAGCVIEPQYKQAMVAAGAWIATFESDDPERNPAPGKWFPADQLELWRLRDREHRQPGFWWWQVISPFVPWEDSAAEWQAAEGQPAKLKVWWQQGLGLPWEELGEAPDHERLLDRRQPWQPRRLPTPVLFLTGSVDVQSDRLEWAVYGWGRKLTGFTVDRGIITGDPTTDGPWRQLDQVITTSYADAWGKRWPVDAWGVDAGYLSTHVYRYVMEWPGDRVRALDGRPGWKLPPIGKPRPIGVDWLGRKIGACNLWPVGTWDIKSELYGKLRLTIKGQDPDGIWPPGCMFFDQSCDRAYFEQLTAEFPQDVIKPTGHTEKQWVVIKGRRNEQHDLAVYALALARHLSDPLTDGEWDALERRRQGAPEAAQLDLALLWAPPIAALEGMQGERSPAAELGQVLAAAAAAPPAPRPVAAVELAPVPARAVEPAPAAKGQPTRPRIASLMAVPPRARQVRSAGIS